MYVCSAESAKSRQHDSVATVGGADMKRGRCVVGTKMQVEFEDGSGTNTQFSDKNTHNYGVATCAISFQIASSASYNASSFIYKSKIGETYNKCRQWNLQSVAQPDTGIGHRRTVVEHSDGTKWDHLRRSYTASKLFRHFRDFSALDLGIWPAKVKNVIGQLRGRCRTVLSFLGAKRSNHFGGPLRRIQTP